MRRAALALALLAVACGPQRRQWRPPDDAPQGAATSFAVVPAGADFYIAPDPRAPTVSLTSPGTARAPWLSDEVVAVRVIGERRGWVAIETLGEPGEAHCAPARPALLPLRLRLYVHARALGAVTVREVDQSFDDGTAVHLARGVPLTGAGHGRLFRAQMGDVTAVVRLDTSAVGTRYLPSAPAERDEPEGWLAADALHAGVPILGQTGRVQSSAAHADAPVYAIEAGGSEARVELRPRCGRLRVRVPAHVVRAPDSVVLGEHTPSPPAPPFAEAGTALYWPGGREAGTVTARIGLGPEEVGESTATHRCFARALHASAEASVVLCVRRDAVDEPGAAARGLAAPGG